MMQQKSIAVIGAGSWGTAVANTFVDAGSSVLLWARSAEVVETINRDHRNPNYLSDIELSSSLKASSDLGATLEQADVVVWRFVLKKSNHSSRYFGRQWRGEHPHSR